MKVTVLMGSPRKKDGYEICKQLESRINRIDKVEFEYIFLKNENIEDCKGCDLCINKDENFCSIKDNLNDIKKKIEESDGVIFSSPVYAHQITAPMKRLIDRLAYLFHRPRFFGKAALIAATTGGSGLKETANYLKLTAVGWGFNLIDSIGVISAFNNRESKYYDGNYSASIAKRLEKSSSAFYEAMKFHKKKKPGLYSLIHFRGMKIKAMFNEADSKYWTEHQWLKADYFYKTGINIFNRMILVLMDILIILMYGKILKLK